MADTGSVNWFILFCRFPGLFDNFFETNRDKRPIKTVRTSELDEFILKIQDDINSIKKYDRFEKIIIPDVNSTIYVN